MKISITNGTVSSIEETITPSAGYSLPTSIEADGATSEYNNNTGNIRLTNLSSNMSITATGGSAMPTNIKKIQAGSTQHYLDAKYVLDSEDVEHSWEDIVSLIGAAFKFIVSTNAANTPEGVQWKSGSTTITGTLTAANADKDAIYLVPHVHDTSDGYDEYAAIGATPAWEKLGHTDVDLSDYAKLAHTHTVTVPTISVDKTKKLGASASGTALSVTANTDFVTSYPGATSNLVTTSITPYTTSSKSNVAILNNSAEVSVLTGLEGNSESATGDIAYIASATAPSLGGTTTFNTDAIKAAALDKKTATAAGYLQYVEDADLSGTTTFNTNGIKAAALDSKATTATGYKKYVEDVALSGTTSFNTNGIKAASLDIKSAETTGYKKYVEDVALGGTVTFNTNAIKSAILDAMDNVTAGNIKVVQDATVGGTFNTDAIKSASLDIKSSSTSGYQQVLEDVTLNNAGTYAKTINGGSLGNATIKYLSASAGQITPTGVQAAITVTSDANGDVFNSASVDANGVLSFGKASLSTDAIKSVNAFTPSITLTANDSTATGRIQYVQAQGTFTPASVATSGELSLTPTKKWIKVTTAAASTGSPTITPTYKWLGIGTQEANSGTVTISPTYKYAGITTTAADNSSVGIDPTIKYMGITTTAADNGSVGINVSKAYMGIATTAASTGTVSLSGGAHTTKYLHVSSANVNNYTLGTDSIAYPVAGTAVTVATGSLNANGTGATVMTGLGTANTAKAVTAVSVSTQPTITITENTSNTGPVIEHTTVGSTSVTTSGGTNPQA